MPGEDDNDSGGLGELFATSGSTDTPDRPPEPEPDVYVMYHGRSHVTGQRLGDYLGVPHGRDPGGTQYDYLLRWGSRSSVRYAPAEGPINSRSALNNNADKYQALELLDSAGVPVPNYARSIDDLEYPMLGRSESHARGEDINLILQQRDDFLTENDFYTEYIPTYLEYRMHVVDGEVVKVHEKRKRHEAENHPYIRNSETGWVFVNPRETPPPDEMAVDAVGALGLDFGAVDVVREENTGDHYVLEVNSAPSLDEANMERYGDAFAEQVGLHDWPGLEAVDFEEEDEE